MGPDGREPIPPYEGTEAPMTFNRIDFLVEWFRLESEHLVDGAPGAEYRRLRDEWLASGRPTPIREWILARANTGPDASGPYLRSPM